MVERSTQVFRSTGQQVGFFVAAIVFALFALDANLQDGGQSSLVWGIFAVLTTAMFLRGAFCGVRTGPEGIRVTNYFGSFDLSWEEIERFEIGRDGFLGAVLLIKLRDGGQRHAFGIQEMHFDEGRKRHPAVELAEALDDELHRHDPRAEPAPPADSAYASLFSPVPHS